MTSRRKKKFLEDLASSGDGEILNVALKHCDDDMTEALTLIQEYREGQLSDVKVDSGPNSLISREQFLGLILDKMRGTRTDSGKFIPTSANEFAQLGKLYADIRGFVQKEQTTVNIASDNRVMIVHDSGSDDEWEEALRLQQAQLVNVQ